MRRAEGRLDEHDDRLAGLEGETRRTRRRLHDLESDRHAVALATQAVTQLAKSAQRAVDSIDAVAEDAARRAIHHERVQRRDGFRRRWTFYAVVAGGVGGLGYLIEQTIVALTS